MKFVAVIWLFILCFFLLSGFNVQKKLDKLQRKDDAKWEYLDRGPFYRIPIEANPDFIRDVIFTETPKVLDYCYLNAKRANKCNRKLRKVRVYFKWKECLNHSDPQTPGILCIYGEKSGARLMVATNRDSDHVRAIYRHELCHRLLGNNESIANSCAESTRRDAASAESTLRDGR